MNDCDSLQNIIYEQPQTPKMKQEINLSTKDLQFVHDLKKIVANARQKVYQTADMLQIASNWLIGSRIVREEQSGQARAKYGQRVLELASEALTAEFGKGYSIVNLKNFRKFFLAFNHLEIPLLTDCESDIHSRQKGQTVSAELNISDIIPLNLSWSHYERLMRIRNEEERDWYMREASAENWSVRTLNRNINSQYYHRLLQTPESKRGEVINEMKLLTADYQKERHTFLRNPVVAEFLGFPQDFAYTETNLESAIINHLQKFILELGKGYAFVARQQRIKTDAGEYFIDLVFYNYILKCFLLIDLKTSQITHEDIGQMDMYIRMYDELKCTEGDNPTIGLLLCSETSKDLARYTILKDSKQLYAAKYLTYLPTKEQLTAEIEYQKEIFALQTGKNDV